MQRLGAGECRLGTGDDVELGALDIDLDQVRRREFLGRDQRVEARRRDGAGHEIAGVVVRGVLAVERGPGGIAFTRQEQWLLAILAESATVKWRRPERCAALSAFASNRTNAASGNTSAASRVQPPR